MQSLLQNLMMKFNCPKYMTEESTARGLHTVQVYNEKIIDGIKGIKQN